MQTVQPSSKRERGVSLPELLVVIAILALGVMVSVPLIADRMHDIKLSSAVSQYTVSLRAARMVAVATRAPVTVSVDVDPQNTYRYVDSKGRLHTFELPDGAWFDTTSTAAISFGVNGSLDLPATTILRTRLSGGRVATWTVELPLSGIPSVTHEIVDY